MTVSPIPTGADAGAGCPAKAGSVQIDHHGAVEMHHSTVNYIADSRFCADDADLRQYAELLGLEEQDTDLWWAVEQAFHAPLPASWTEHTDEEGRCYFFHEASNRSTWEHPTDAVYTELINVVKASRRENLPVADRVSLIHNHLRQTHERAVHALEGWSGPYASEHGEYYYNEGNGISTWESPMAEWENELQVRHNVLCRCLLPEIFVNGDTMNPGYSGSNLMALHLPLNLVPRIDRVDQPETPSTTRSERTYRTARSVCSSRSAAQSSRSGDKMRRDNSS